MMPRCWPGDRNETSFVQRQRCRTLDVSNRIHRRANIASTAAEMWEKDTKLHQQRHISLDPLTVAVLKAYNRPEGAAPPL